MKRKFLTSLIAMVCLGQVVMMSDSYAAKGFGKRYDLNSAIIKYDIEGDKYKGREELYIDKGGIIEGRHTQTDMSFMGFNQSVDTLHLIEEEWSYNYDKTTKIVTKMNLNDLKESGMLSQKKGNFQDYSQEAIESFGGVNIGTEKILGKLCDIIEFKSFGSKVWIYKGVPLKYTMSMPPMGEVTYLANSFQENVKIPRDKITIPADAQEQQVPDFGNIKAMMSGQAGAHAETENAEADAAAGFNQAGAAEIDEEEMQRKMEEAQKAMQDAGPEMEKAFGALKAFMNQ